MMKFISKLSVILILFLCSTFSKPMAIDYERLSKQSDDLLRQEIFPADYDQYSLNQKIQNVRHYINEVEKAHNLTRIAAKINVDAPNPSLAEMADILYKLEVLPRIIRIYKEELDKLEMQQQIQE